MKRIIDKRKSRRVSLALGLLLDELEAIKPVISSKQFDLLIEGVVLAIRYVPAITKGSRSAGESVPVAMEPGETHEPLTQGPGAPQDQR